MFSVILCVLCVSPWPYGWLLARTRAPRSYSAPSRFFHFRISTKWPSIAAAAAIRDSPGACGRPCPGGLRSSGSRCWRCARRSAAHRHSSRCTCCSPRRATRIPRRGKSCPSPSVSASAFTRLRAGNHQRLLQDPSTRVCPPTTCAARRKSSMPRIRARADEHAVERNVFDRRSGLQIHVYRARVPRPSGPPDL